MPATRGNPRPARRRPLRPIPPRPCLYHHPPRRAATARSTKNRLIRCISRRLRINELSCRRILNPADMSPQTSRCARRTDPARIIKRERISPARVSLSEIARQRMVSVLNDFAVRRGEDESHERIIMRRRTFPVAPFTVHVPRNHPGVFEGGKEICRLLSIPGATVTVRLI